MRSLRSLVVLAAAFVVVGVATLSAADARPLNVRERNAAVVASVAAPIGAIIGYAHCGPVCGWSGLGIGAVAGAGVGYVLPPVPVPDLLGPIFGWATAPAVAILSPVTEPLPPKRKRSNQ